MSQAFQSHPGLDTNSAQPRGASCSRSPTGGSVNRPALWRGPPLPLHQEEAGPQRSSFPGGPQPAVPTALPSQGPSLRTPDRRPSHPFLAMHLSPPGTACSSAGPTSSPVSSEPSLHPEEDFPEIVPTALPRQGSHAHPATCFIWDNVQPTAALDSSLHLLLSPVSSSNLSSTWLWASQMATTGPWAGAVPAHTAHHSCPVMGSAPLPRPLAAAGAPILVPREDQGHV